MGHGATLAIILVVIVVLAAWWLILRARRVDSLHRQVMQAKVTVNRHLKARRATLLDAESLIRAIDTQAANDLRKLINTAEPEEFGHTSSTESAITRWLRDVFFPRFATANAELRQVAHKLETNAFELQAARRFYNQQVAQTQRLRMKPDVLIFHLAGHAEMPETYDFDDQIE